MLFLTVAYWKYFPRLYCLTLFEIFVSFHARNTTILTNKAIYTFRWNHYSVNRYRYKISNDFIMATIVNMSSCGFLGQYSQPFLPRGPNRFCCYIIHGQKGLPGVSNQFLFICYKGNEVLRIRPLILLQLYIFESPLTKQTYGEQVFYEEV